MGSFLIAAASICIVLFVLWGGAKEGYPWDGGVIIGLLIASGVLLVLFILQELRHPFPIVELQMFKVRNVACIMPIMFGVGIQMMAGFSFLPIYFQSVLGDSSIISGVKIFPMIGGFLLGAGVSSAMLKKFNRVNFLLPEGAVLLTIGVGLLNLIRPDTPFGIIAALQIAFGLGMGACMAVTAVVLQNSVPASQMGICMSAYSFFMLLGGALGVAGLGALLNHATESNLPTSTSYQDALCKALNLVFLATSAPGVLVFLISWLVQDVQLPEKAAVGESEVIVV